MNFSTSSNGSASFVLGGIPQYAVPVAPPPAPSLPVVYIAHSFGQQQQQPVAGVSHQQHQQQQQQQQLHSSISQMSSSLSALDPAQQQVAQRGFTPGQYVLVQSIPAAAVAAAGANLDQRQQQSSPFLPVAFAPSTPNAIPAPAMQTQSHTPQLAPMAAANFTISSPVQHVTPNNGAANYGGGTQQHQQQQAQQQNAAQYTSNAPLQSLFFIQDTSQLYTYGSGFDITSQSRSSTVHGTPSLSASAGHRHDPFNKSTDSKNSSVNSETPCRHFMEGKCNRRKCRFKHEADSNSASLGARPANV